MNALLADSESRKKGPKSGWMKCGAAGADRGLTSSNPFLDNFPVADDPPRMSVASSLAPA
jgi:hypothetical protein